MEFEASNNWEILGAGPKMWMVGKSKKCGWMMCNEQRKMNFGERSGDPGVHHQKLWFFRNSRWDTINEEFDWTHQKKMGSDTQTWNLNPKKIAGIIFFPLKMFTAPSMADSVPSMGFSITEPFFFNLGLRRYIGNTYLTNNWYMKCWMVWEQTTNLRRYWKRVRLFVIVSNNQQTGLPYWDALIITWVSRNHPSH